MLTKIISNKVWLIFVFYFVLHTLLLNVNYAEWGDSYRILRASEFIRQGTYPQDEKRAPLYSMFLAVRPAVVDQVIWGRYVMLGLSTLSLYVFYLIIKQYNLNQRVENLSLWLLALNPVFLYWSLRIMADVPFTLIVLLVFYFYKKWEDQLLWWRLLILGTLLGLGVLTRFEGYILGLALGIDLAARAFLSSPGKENRKALIGKVAKNLTLIFTGFISITFWWFLFRNPFSSTYFEEPSGRAYDLKTVYIYLVSSMYLFGFSSACYFFVKSFNRAKEFLTKNIFLSVFLVVELLLALVWPAAIPRLFIPAIPFLVIILAILVDDEFSKTAKFKVRDVSLLAFLLAFYIFSQYVLKLQFLVLTKTHLVVVASVQLLIICAVIAKKYKLFKMGLVLSMLLWSFSTIYLHKDIFKAVVEANKYSVTNLEGKIAYNDVSSVSDWYLNQRSDTDKVTGMYLNMDSKAGRSYEILAEESIDYVMITNEHNTDMEFSANETDYLEQLTEFRYTIRGKEFFTKIVKLVPYDRH